MNNLIEKQVNVIVDSNIDFGFEQFDALWDLNKFSVLQALKNKEVQKDIRKLSYVANQELRDALVAILLSYAIVDLDRKNFEFKEFFSENIAIKMTSKKVKEVNFCDIKTENVLEAVNQDIVDDWKVFRDKDGMGIKALVDLKTNYGGLDGFLRGGDPIYEFARFKRKYAEKYYGKEDRMKEKAQEVFRHSVVEALAGKVVEQQLLEGKTIGDVMSMVDVLFTPTNPIKHIKNIEKKDNQNMLGYDDKSREYSDD